MAREYEHGQHQRYSAGCRCDLCRGAWATRARERRAKAKTEPTPEKVHGTVNGYSFWSCRCAECSEAAAKAYRANRHPDLEEKVRQARLEGYRNGLEEGKKIGERIGERKGYKAGYKEGNDEGYKAGLGVNK